MILVTGASGFIGSHVCRLLAARGRSVVGLDRQGGGLAQRQIAADIGAPEALDAIARAGPFDTVVHLAAVLKSASRRQPEEAMRVNIGGSLGLLALAARSGVRRFIFGSTISVYGPAPFAAHGAVAEDRPPAPDTIYGASKRYVELAGQDYGLRGALEFVALRIAVVVGAGARSAATPWRGQLFERLAAGEPGRIELPFAREERLPLIHVADVAEAIGRLVDAERPAASVYNTPAEVWAAGALGDAVRALDARIEVAYSPAPAQGDPEALSGERFAREFGFELTPLRLRLRQAAEGRA